MYFERTLSLTASYFLIGSAFFAAANVFRSCGDRFQRVFGEQREMTFVDFNIIFWDFYGTRLCVKISILNGLSSIYLLSWLTKLKTSKCFKELILNTLLFAGDQFFHF